MEWWDRRSVCGFADRQSQSDRLASRAVHGDHRKWPITAPHSRLPLSRSCPLESRDSFLLASPYLPSSSPRRELSNILFYCYTRARSNIHNLRFVAKLLTSIIFHDHSIQVRDCKRIFISNPLAKGRRSFSWFRNESQYVWYSSIMKSLFDNPAKKKYVPHVRKDIPSVDPGHSRRREANFITTVGREIFAFGSSKKWRLTTARLPHSRFRTKIRLSSEYPNRSGFVRTMLHRPCERKGLSLSFGTSPGAVAVFPRLNASWRDADKKDSLIRERFTRARARDAAENN